VYQDLQVLSALEDFLEREDQVGELGNQGSKVKGVKMEIMEILGHLGFREFLVLKELLEILVHWVCKGVKVTLEYLGNQDPEEIRGKKGYMDCLDQLVLQDQQEKGELQAAQVQEDFKDYQEFQGKMECLEKMEMAEYKESQE